MAPINRIKTEMVGQSFGPFVRDYTFRDLELFALGCGAGIDGRNDLQYLNEHDERDHGEPMLPEAAHDQLAVRHGIGGAALRLCGLSGWHDDGHREPPS